MDRKQMVWSGGWGATLRYCWRRELVCSVYSFEERLDRFADSVKVRRSGYCLAGLVDL
jgi:hypothetical protein